MPDVSRDVAPTVTNAEIRDLVFEFYDRVREHPELGPLFEQPLAGRWPEHLEKMCDFWNSVLRGTRSYRGDPMNAHARIPGIAPAHFSAWIELFAETAGDVLPPAPAADVIDRAERMRNALERFALGDRASGGGAHAAVEPPSTAASSLPITRA